MWYTFIVGMLTNPSILRTLSLSLSLFLSFCYHNFSPVLSHYLLGLALTELGLVLTELNLDLIPSLLPVRLYRVRLGFNTVSYYLLGLTELGLDLIPSLLPVMLYRVRPGFNTLIITCYALQS